MSLTRADLSDGARHEVLEAIARSRAYLAFQARMGFSSGPGNLARGCGTGGARQGLQALADEVGRCRKCRLCEGRNTVVVGAGNPAAEVMFVGEAPGAEEDRQGVPFVGEAGALLTKMIQAIGFSRDEVYIANVIKCRPPGNRDPEPDEVASCAPYLMRQVHLIEPVVLCALGRFAAQCLLGSDEPIGRLRGRLHPFQGRGLVCTYHPAALLRNPQWKRPAWEDLKLLRRAYDAARA